MPIKRPIKLLLTAAVALVVLIVGGTWVYINIIRDDPPDRLTLEVTVTNRASSSTTAGTASSTGVDGTWTVGSGSIAGYRVKEVLFGQSAEAVGRTSEVAGSITIDGSSVSSARIAVDLTTVTSDQSRRDGQFQGRIMDTATYPTATFRLTLHGTTKTVTVELQTKKTAAGSSSSSSPAELLAHFPKRVALVSAGAVARCQ